MSVVLTTVAVTCFVILVWFAFYFLKRQRATQGALARYLDQRDAALAKAHAADLASLRASIARSLDHVAAEEARRGSGGAALRRVAEEIRAGH